MFRDFTHFLEANAETVT